MVRGVVVDGAGAPHAGVTIQAAGGRPVTSDDSGRFRLEILHRDKTTFDLRRVGLMPSRFGLSAGGDTAVTVVMLGVVQSLEKVDVTAKETDRAMDITGFNQRLAERTKGTTSGYFITAAEIEQRRPARIHHLFDQFPSVRCAPGGTFSSCMLIGSHHIPNPNPERGRGYIPCAITVYLDGHRLNSLKSSDSAVDIEATVSAMDLAGIEYYPSGNRIPDKFHLLNGSCGLVALWTKRG